MKRIFLAFILLTSLTFAQSRKTVIIMSSGTVVDVAPSAPVNLIATAGVEQITLDWDANTEPDLYGYVIYRDSLGAEIITDGIDWTDGNSDGLGDNWSKVNGVASIVTGNGFEGNAQRLYADATANTLLTCSPTFVPNTTYKISLKIRNNNGAELFLYEDGWAGTLKSFTANEGDAVYSSIIYTTTAIAGAGALRIYMRSSGGDGTLGDYFEADDVSIKKYITTTTHPDIPIDTVLAGTETFVNTGLLGAVTYNYRIKALDNAGNLSDYTANANATALADTVPTQFTFTDETDVVRSTADTSNGIVLASLDSAYASISGAGGTYRVGALGTFISTSSMVHGGDTIWVKNTSSASYNTAVNTVLTVGGVSDTYTITTLATPPYFEQFADGNYTSNPEWTVVSGTFAVNNSVANTINDNDYALNSTATGTIYTPSSQAYGTWEFDVYYTSLGTGDRQYSFISSGTSATNTNGYTLIIGYNGVITFRRYTGTGFGTLMTYSGGGLFANATWYRIKIVRNETTDQYVTGAKGTFALYHSTNGTDYTLVTATTGTNPVTNDVHTTSTNFIEYCEGANSRISNIKIY